MTCGSLYVLIPRNPDESHAHNADPKTAEPAEEVAAYLLWLLSPAAAYVAGTILPVAGGWFSKPPV